MAAPTAKHAPVVAHDSQGTSFASLIDPSRSVIADAPGPGQSGGHAPLLAYMALQGEEEAFAL